MTVHGLNDAKQWRDGAAEMRALSADMKDCEARTLKLKLANDYDKLGDRAEVRAASDKTLGPSPIPQSKGRAVTMAAKRRARRASLTLSLPTLIRDAPGH